MATLGEWVADIRVDKLKVTQTVLAGRAGVSRQTMQAIEGGKIKKPSPDIRRRLAKALGVSHLDVLVAADEITPDEITAAGAVGVIERDPTSPAAQLAERIRTSQLSDRRLKELADYIVQLEAWDREGESTMQRDVNAGRRMKP